MLSKVHRFLSLLYFFSIFTFLFLYGIRVCAFVNEAPLSYQQVTRQHLGESSQTFLPFPEKGKEMFFYGRFSKLPVNRKYVAFYLRLSPKFLPMTDNVTNLTTRKRGKHLLLYCKWQGSCPREAHFHISPTFASVNY